MLARRWFAGVLALAAQAGAWGPARADGETVPRYRLEVGQALRYEATYDFRYDKRPDSGHGDRITATIWVVDREEGGWAVVLRRRTTPSYRREGRTIEQDPQDETVTFRLLDDGRVVTEDEDAGRIRFEEYFPALPGDAAAAGKGWRSHDPREGRTLQYERVPKEDGPGRWAFRAIAEHPMDPIVLATHRYRMSFDLARGLLADSESEYTQRYGHVGKGVQTTRLAAVDRLGDEEVARLREDARRYAEARRSAAALGRRIREAKARAEVERLQAEIQSALVAARDAVRGPAIREQLDRVLEGRRGAAKGELQNAERRGAMIGSAAPAWELRDLEGGAHSLAGQRGKVVVLDFWYRGCGPCVQSMPGVKRAAARFAERLVAVFGMNTDEDAADARFVAAAMSLGYPTLLASGTDLAASYGSSDFGFPTLVVIDREGVIRWVHTGYAPDLSERISEAIEPLLGEK